MSELGHKLRQLRGERTLRDVARTTKIAMRTIWRAENGVFIKIETLEQLLTGQLVPKSDWPIYIMAWIKDAISPENWASLDVRPARGLIPKNPTLEKIKHRLTDLSHEQQHLILSMLSDDHVMAAILPIASIAEDAVAYRTRPK